MTNTQATVYTTRRCTCYAADPTLTLEDPIAVVTAFGVKRIDHLHIRVDSDCGYPFCATRRCDHCHICRFVGADPLPVLTSDEQRFLVAWNQLPNQMEQDRLTAAETRLVFKLGDMGLIDA